MIRHLSLAVRSAAVSLKGQNLWPHLGPWGLVGLYILTFTWLAIMRHLSFNSSSFDLGIYDQVVWNTLHGRIFFYTTTGLPLLHLSNHADPILLLVAPFYLIYDGPETLLFLQAAAIGLGGLPVFWLAREKLNSEFAAFSLLIAYLLFPALQVVTIWDFHPPALATGFLAYAFYFMVKKKPVWFLLLATLAMACKEQIPLLVIFMGLYLLIHDRNWRLGLATIFYGAAWFVVVMYWVIPAYSVEGEHIFLGYYSDLGDSPLEIIGAAIAQPNLILQTLLQPDRLAYLRDIFLPFAFLSLFGLPVLLIGLPSLAINLLSVNPAMHDATGGQYISTVAPWLGLGAVYGMFYLSEGLTRFWPAGKVWIVRSLSVILLVVAGIWQVFRGFSPLALDPPRWEITDHDRLAQRFIAQIPPDASLSAQGKLYPHLSHRLIAYHIPDINEAEYVFLDVTTGTWPVHPNDVRSQFRSLLSSGEFGILDAADGYILLKRGLLERTLPDAFYDFARASEIQPQYAVNVQFGDALRLLGYDVIDDRRRQETAVRLYWQALRPLDQGLRLYPFFVDAENRVVEDTGQRPLLTQLWYPPELWLPGEVVFAETMPWTLGNRWSLAVGVLAGDNWADWSQRLLVEGVEPSMGARTFEARTWARLGTFERQGRNLVEVDIGEQDFVPAQLVEANFDRQISLLGYDTSLSQNELTVTLQWQAQTQIDLDYSVFIHLVDANGNLVAQHDGQPWWEVTIPTSTWQPGEKLRDRHPIALPADLPPGTYYLRAGLYYWQTLERLPVLENGVPVNNFVDLGPVTIE
jgi:uncharacterized membrane protein